MGLTETAKTAAFLGSYCRWRRPAALPAHQLAWSHSCKPHSEMHVSQDETSAAERSQKRSSALQTADISAPLIVGSQPIRARGPCRRLSSGLNGNTRP